jgi:hypothetical protein
MSAHVLTLGSLFSGCGDVLQQPLDFSTSPPDVIYHLKPHQPKKS